MTNPRSGRRYMAAIAALKARGEMQNCWRCGKRLYAHLPWPDPLCVTLGHLVALEDGGDVWDPANHAAECIPCNMGDGARRTNRKRALRRERAQHFINSRW